MQHLEDLQKYITKELRLDKSLVYAFVGDGDIVFNNGSGNQSFQFCYDGNVRITGFQSDRFHHLLFAIKQYMLANQTMVNGSKQKPKIETEPLTQNTLEVYISVKLIENIQVSDHPKGTLLQVASQTPNHECLVPAKSMIIPRHEADK